jgi:hypothetical protein
MDINTYAIERYVESRLAQLRSDAARCRLVASLQKRSVGPRPLLALALLRMGRRLSGRGAAVPRAA